MDFERKVNAPDGVHDMIQFNEYRNAKWWTEQRCRRELIDKVAPLAIIAGTLLSFVIMAHIENAI